MMEEIDRFQVPPVNGETQPLVRDRGQTKTHLMQIILLNVDENSFVSFVVRFIATAVSHHLRVRASR